MKVPIPRSDRLSPWLQAEAALMGGLVCIGAAGSAVLAAASQGTLVEETVIAASTGIASGLVGMLSIVWARQMRSGGW